MGRDGSSGRWWNDGAVRGILYQSLLFAALLGGAWFLIRNTLANLEARHIATGFGFLGGQAGFGLSESPIGYVSTDSVFRALLAGLLNTAKVALPGIILATILGFIVGLARLSRNPLLARMAGGYVELIRDVPLLLQLLFWYALLTQGLPPPSQAFSLGNALFLCDRGLLLPLPVWRDGHLALEVPRLATFNFTGGIRLSPEFSALSLGLTTYTGAFIAEIVRGGILAVPRGQTEAALALGLSRGAAMRLVVLPQSLRVIVPPLTNQYLNLAKNSTLAIAIGYPDLLGVSNTVINLTGQAVEGVFIAMLVYLAISLSLSGLLNLYNRRVQFGRGGRE